MGEALTCYSQDIARDNAPYGITVFVVAPGPVEGQMFEGLKEDVKVQCLASMPTGKPVKIQEVVDIIDILSFGQSTKCHGGYF
ncbi:MAG: SDR family oxidoreductase [Alphaproteobacteria bacterium]|nr:SDR family oxidoreductase [Alphaproteobacteria bacterium]